MGHKLSTSILLASAIGLSLFGGYKVGELNASLEATRHIDSLRQERLSTVSDLKSQIGMQKLEINNLKIVIDATNKFYGERIGELQNQLMVSQVKLKMIFESDPLKGKLDGYALRVPTPTVSIVDTFLYSWIYYSKMLKNYF